MKLFIPFFFASLMVACVQDFRQTQAPTHTVVYREHTVWNQANGRVVACTMRCVVEKDGTENGSQCTTVECQ